MGRPLLRGPPGAAPREHRADRRQGNRSRIGPTILSGGPRWTVYADGASRGNPGQASIGAVVYDEAGKEAATVSDRIGHGTNNEAEYRAAIAGLERALELGGGAVDLRMDSELIIRQLQGRYKVRNARLAPFYHRLVALLGRFDTVTFEHVPRARNARADELANLALDRKESG